MELNQKKFFKPYHAYKFNSLSNNELNVGI